LATAIATIGAFVLTLAFVYWDKISLQEVGVRFTRRSLLRFGLAFLAGLSLPALQAALMVAYGNVQFERMSLFEGQAVWLSLVMYVCLACREELAFRGYPLRRLDQAFGAWRAQLIIAGMFAVEHAVGGMTWVHAVLGAGVGSILFGTAALMTRGLAVPIGIHAAWNFGQWILGEKESPGLWQIANNGRPVHTDVAETVSYLFVMALALCAFGWWRWRRTRSSPRREEYSTR